MRVAFLSPLPPTPSGIADYSARLLPRLRNGGLELELFHDGPAAADLGGFGPALPVRQFSPGPSAMALYQVGNDPRFHGGIYRAALRHPGIVVLHETMIHHLVRQVAVDEGGPDAYRREMARAYGASGQALGQGFMEMGITEGLWRFPLFERLVDRSLGVIVHSQAAARRIRASRPGALVNVVPMLPQVPETSQAKSTEGARAAVLRRLRLPEDAFLVGCFGLLTAQKRLPVLLEAFRELRRQVPRARLILVGGASGDYEMPALLAGEAGQGVVHTGRVPEEELLEAMAAVDVAVNLRYPTGGETSATFIQMLQLGRAVIVTNEGSFAEVPDGCCAKVDPGDEEGALLAAYLLRLAADAPLRRQMGENARRYLDEHAAPQRIVEGYRQALERARAVPPPAPEPPPVERGQMDRRLQRAVGEGLADLGVGEKDSALPAIAATVAEVVRDRTGEAP